MADPSVAYLTPEAKARVEIDGMLAAAGWAVQSAGSVNLAASRGVAVREFVMKPPHGRADYLLFLDGRAAGVVEAKREGETLTGVEWQSARYVDGLPDELEPTVEGGLPFVYESTGTETRFTNRLDPDASSRSVFSFHRPETLASWLDEIRRHPTAPTLRHRLRALPPLEETGLWPVQFRAITNLETSLAANRPRALIQMATGSGKTFTAANAAYRLVKFADARRILFLVDRANLGRQTLKEFQGFTTPGDGRKAHRALQRAATGKKADELIAAFRNSYNPRIAVTVDMIATGTDVKPLECVFFIRSVKSRTYFEQMKGRGVRVIGEADFQAVTPDARAKERFVIVDAVGVTETELADTVPLDRKPTVPLERLLRQVSFGVRDPDIVSSIAARLSRLDRRLGKDERGELETLAGGRTLRDIAGGIVAALDPDRQLATARAATGSDEPTVADIATAARTLLDHAVAPLATSPELRERIVDLRRMHEQAIDETSTDEVIEAGYSEDAAHHARQTVESWERFCDEHRDEITALQILYARRQPQRLTFREVKELAQTIARPPHRWTPETLWRAYEQLDRSKVRGSGERVLTDLVSLVRVALHQEHELVPYPDLVRERYHAWLLQQDNAGRVFTAEQLAWLERIRDHVAAALGITTDDFAYTPFAEAGGLGKAAQVFGEGLGPLLDGMNEVLAA